MTEKRFIGGSYGFWDSYKKERMLWSDWEEVIRIMNNLDLKARERGKALSKLQRENEHQERLIKRLDASLRDVEEDCKFFEGELKKIRKKEEGSYD